MTNINPLVIIFMKVQNKDITHVWNQKIRTKELKTFLSTLILVIVTNAIMVA